MTDSNPAADAATPDPTGEGLVGKALADARLVRELAEVLNDTGLTEIEMERGDLRVRVVKAPPVAAAVYAAAPAPVQAHVVGHAPAPAQAAPAAAPEPAAPAPPAGDILKSPMVGTVYLQSQPGAPPFVKVGDSITEGQTILLVEAMKTMNPILAPRSGVLRDLMVADGQPVEYGEPLAVIG